MLFTSKQITLLLERLSDETVVEATEGFPYKIVREGQVGWSKDKEIAHLQAKLSIMLEAAHVYEAHIKGDV